MMPSFVRRAWITAAAGMVLASPCLAEDDIDRALQAQQAKPRVTLSSSQGVSEAVDQRQGAVMHRANERERQRAEAIGNATKGSSGSSSVTGRQTASESSTRGGPDIRFVCRYSCKAPMTMADKSHQTLTVHAPDQKTAVARSVAHAIDNCFRDTRKLFDAGTASCRPA